FNANNLRAILVDRLYELYCDEDLLKINSFADIKQLEEISLIILRKYIDSWYKRRQQEWEYTQLEYHPFRETDKNIPNYAENKQGYQLRVKKTAVDKIEKEIETLFKNQEIWTQSFEDNSSQNLPRVYFDRHIYLPLL